MIIIGSGHAAFPLDGRIIGGAVSGMEGGELAAILQLAEAFNNLITYGKRT